MKKKERELVEKLLTEWIVCYKDCFCQDSPEKWIKMFAEKRLETFLADKKDYIEEVTGVDLSNSKNLKEFRSLYKSMFLEIITNHLVEIGKLQGIPIIDHINMGEDNYYSFYENDALGR